MNKRLTLFAAGVAIALAGAGCASSGTMQADSNAAQNGQPAVSANIDAAVSGAVNDSDSIDRGMSDETTDQNQLKADDDSLNAYSDSSYDLK
ncbi:MAG TPA: hypothetical protein VMU11_00755 [Verrucomicrobiae bacterium]|nr:hypothetical protein [Verrucomicrobiae bacterium]